MPSSPSPAASTTQAAAIAAVVSSGGQTNPDPDGLEVISRRASEHEQETGAQGHAEQAAQAGRDGGLGEEQPDHVPAPTAQRDHQADLAGPFGDDGGEDQSDQKARTQEEHRRKQEHAPQQGRGTPADRGCGRARRDHLHAGPLGDGEAHALRGGSVVEQDQDRRDAAGVVGGGHAGPIPAGAGDGRRGLVGDEEPMIEWTDARDLEPAERREGHAAE